MPMHTPGPWHQGAGNGEGSIFGPEHGGRMRMERGGTTLYPICTMVTGWEAAEDRANAALIADAPHMLDLLRRLCEWEARMGGFDALPWREARALLARLDGVPQDEAAPA